MSYAEPLNPASNGRGEVGIIDPQQVERCLELVAADRASGQKAKAWVEVNGVALGTLVSWYALARRWQARHAGRTRADGRDERLRRRPREAEYRCRLGAMRIEVNAGAARLDLHWLLTHSLELAALLREFGR